MSVEQPGPARDTYRRLRSAAGLAELPALEKRIERLEGDVAEELGLHPALADVVGRLEADVVPLLERRVARAARPAGSVGRSAGRGDPGHSPSM